MPPNPDDSDSATSANTSAPVSGTGWFQSSGIPLPDSSGALSRASGAAWAACSAAATRALIAAGSTALVRIEPVCEVLPLRTMEITVVERVVDTPLVVIELPAQRSEASARSVTMTMVSSANRWRACSASSTTCCAGIMRGPPQNAVLSTLTPRNNADGQPWLTAAT